MLHRARAVAALLLSLTLSAHAGRGVKAVPPVAAPTGVPTGNVPLIPSLGARVGPGKIVPLPVRATQTGPAGIAPFSPVDEHQAPAIEAAQRVQREAGEDGAQAQEAGAQAFDGAAPRPEEGVDGPRALEPAFEPPRFKTPAPVDPNAKRGAGQAGQADDENARRLTLNFNVALRSQLVGVEKSKSIYGAIKRVRDLQGSREYYKQYKKGVELDITVSRGETIFGRPTTITRAVSKKIRDLTRDDFRGTIPEAQLQAPIRQLRQRLIDQLEESRRTWNAHDVPVSGASTVRVIHFKSYVEMYREVHGKTALPQIDAPAPRTPLLIKPEGVLKPLSMLLPRAVFLDLDLFDGPVSKEIINDMAKLQRTGVYFVAVSRKPYAEANSIKDKLIRQLSSYHLGILMPIRFLAVTDDGAVISAFPKGGDVAPVSVDAFSDGEMDILRDAAQKAFEEAGLHPAPELKQPAIDHAVDEFPGLTRRGRGERKDPQVRFELRFPKAASSEAFELWIGAFEKRLKSQGLVTHATITALDGGARSFAVRKTSLASSLPRLIETLGKRFGLYLNPGDILVLSEDKALRQANPGLDFAGVTGLKGAALAENGLGLLLGEHRESLPLDLTGSASRMNSFSYNRTRYLAQLLVEERQAEENINFFSGHVVHAVNDWVVNQLQNGKRPTAAEYATQLRDHWNEGLRAVRPVGLPEGEDMEGWLRESTQRGLNMFQMIVDIHDRGEVLIGTEIPNFFVVKDFERRTGELKRRFILHTIFDFIALRPDPKDPTKATLVIYDFKTGPAQSRQKLDKDLQVLTYALFANRKWVGQQFPAPYLSGTKSYEISEARVEFIYGAVKQPTTVTANDLDTIRRTIISKLMSIHRSEQALLGEKKPTKKKPAKKKPAKKKPAR